jgi:hypothetical protein
VGCSLIPQDLEEESCSDKALSSPPSYLFEASFESSSPHEVLPQGHSENDTCQIEA